MPRTTRALAIALSLLAMGRLPSSAQAPGAQGAAPGSIRSEFMAEVLDRVNDVMEEWARAWSADDVDTLAEAYAENAILLPREGEAVLGRAAIREYLEGRLPGHAGIEAFMRDFDAGDGLAMIYGYYRLEEIQERGPAQSTSGTLITVLARVGRRDWRIRSQVFRPNGG